MNEYSVYYRYNGSTSEFQFFAESFEHARERVLMFKASKEDEPRIHCLGNGTAVPEKVPDATLAQSCSTSEQEGARA
jgi:hypothetical protein